MIELTYLESLMFMGLVTDVILNTRYKVSKDGHIILHAASIGKRDSTTNTTSKFTLLPAPFLS